MVEPEQIELPPHETLDEREIDPSVVAPHGIPCAACGCPVEADDKFCPACGTVQVIEARVAVDESPQSKRLHCDNCGSDVATDQMQRSYTCPFCDSNYVVEVEADETPRQRPEFVIGFAVTREQAHETFRQWLSANSWFRPGDLHSASLLDKLQGVYLPFWSFSMLAQSRWSATIGEYWYRTETYTTRDSKGNVVTRTRRVRETEWWPLQGKHHRYHSGYLVSGSRGLSQADAERIKPFNLPALKRYEPYYLAGWLAEEYSVVRDEAQNLCQQEFSRHEQRNVAAFLPGDTHRGLEVSTNFSHINSDLCLLPIYIASYRYRDKLYRFLLNGQTGKCIGDKPLSWKKIAVVAIVAAVLLAITAATVYVVAQHG